MTKFIPEREPPEGTVLRQTHTDMLLIYKLLLMSIRILGPMLILYGCFKYRFSWLWLIPALVPGGIFCFPLFYHLKWRLFRSLRPGHYYTARAKSAALGSWLLVLAEFALALAIWLWARNAGADAMAQFLDTAPFYDTKLWFSAAVIAAYCLVLIRINWAKRGE